MRWIQQEELLEITGYKHPGWLKRSLDKQGIEYILGRRGRISVPSIAIERHVAQPDRSAVEFL